MNLFILIVGSLIILVGFVVAFGAPYLPTLKKQTTEALDLLDLKKGQTLLELGCGDGRVAKAAAQRGWQVIGYELSPVLVVIAKLNTYKYRGQVQIRWGNFWRHDWPQSDGIFVFLLDKYMKKLDKKIIQQRVQQGTRIRLVSFTFKIPDKKIAGKKEGLLLYEYK